MRFFGILLFAAVLELGFLECSSSTEELKDSETETGGGDVDGDTDTDIDTDTGLDTTTDTETETTTESVECEASVLIDPSGGTYELCGAGLFVPPEAAPLEPVEVSVVRTPQTDTPSCLLEPAGDLFEFSSAETPFQGYVAITIPHSGLLGRRCSPFILEDGEWYGIEPCDITETEATFVAGGLASFTVLRDTHTYPSSTTGLGSGTVQVDLDGAVSDLSLDSPLSYGFHSESCDGGRSLNIVACKSGAEAPIDCIPTQFYAAFSFDAEGGSQNVVQVSFDDWDWVIVMDSEPMVLEVTSIEGNHVQGTLTGPVYQGEETRTLTAVFDVTTEEYVFPPEFSCLNEME
jgi:hypothetical protein